MRNKILVVLMVLLAGSVVGAMQNAPTNPTNLGNDANGNPLRKALKTGHISNYDETKVAPYTLPDPLVLSSGQRVRNADAWMKQRRPELIRLYENEIYGRVPDNAPKVRWENGEIRTSSWRNGTAKRKRLVAHVGNASNERSF